MAFSIFNKSGQDGKADQDPTKSSGKSPLKDVPKKGGDDNKSSFPQTVTASLVSRPTGALPANSPEMMAYDLEEINIFQEVAILYASDYLDTAQKLLKTATSDKGSGPQAWLMLLDLYKFRGMKNDFEDVAMNYTVKFEKSPPTWHDDQLNTTEARKEVRQNSDFFSFQSKDNFSQEINKLIEFVTRTGSARVDVGRIKNVKPDEAEVFAKALLDFRKRKMILRFNNVNSFVDLLKKTIAENSSKEFSPLWVLLFELYQRLGMQNEFEDLGLEYAMGFEMSPPSWESIAVVEENTASTEADSQSNSETPASQGFPLRGTISLDNLTQIQMLMNHAASHKEVHVNMAGLQKIDFAAIGSFVDALNKLATAGKKVVLVDVGELIFPLFESFSINRMAVMLRQKAQ